MPIEITDERFEQSVCYTKKELIKYINDISQEAFSLEQAEKILNIVSGTILHAPDTNIVYYLSAIDIMILTRAISNIQTGKWNLDNNFPNCFTVWIQVPVTDQEIIDLSK